MAAADTTPFAFDVFGDWGQVDANGSSADQANLFAQVANSGARFAVAVGDNGYPNGSQTNYGDLVQTGADTSAIFGPAFWTVAGSSIPLFSTVGNHGLSGSSHTDITTWTQDSAVATSGGRYQNDTYCCVNGSNSSNYGSEWYAFDAGNARFYVLDSAWGDTNPGTASVYANDAAAHFAPGTPQYTWLLNDLQTHPTALKFAFSHYPLYSDNPSQPSDTFLQGPDNLEGLLGRYGVNVAFNGHAHIYERNSASAPGMPITYVTGGGGALLEPIGPCHSYDAYGIGWSPTKLTGTRCGAAPTPSSASQVFHFLKVTVNGTSVTVTPTDENGRTFDSQTYNFPSKPNTVIDSGPGPLSNSTSATFTFHSTRPGATFGCSLDGAASVACGSPITYNGLATGAHTFSVASTTASGTDPTPDVRNWTIDRSPPSTPTNLTGSAVSSSRVNLSWTASTDNTGVTGYDVARNGAVIATAGGTTTSYADNTARASTTYQYSVAARDGAGNVSPSVAVSVTTPAAPPGPTFVQAAGSSTTTVSLPAPSTPGDLLVLSAGVYTGLSRPIAAVTDGRNTWTKVGAYAVSGQNSDGEMWYAANAASVTSITVTTSASTVGLEVQEFAGVAQTAPLDGSNGAVATSTSASSGSASPTGANDLAVGFIAGHGSSQPIGVTSVGYTTQSQVTSTSPSTVSVASGYQTLGSTSAQSFAGNFPNRDVLVGRHRAVQGGFHHATAGQRLLDRGFAQLGHRDRGAGNHEHDQHRRHEWCCPAGHAERLGRAQRYDGLVQPDRDQRGPELHDDGHDVHVDAGWWSDADHGHRDRRDREPRHDVLPHGHRGGLERLLDRGFAQLGHRDRGAGNHEHDQHRRHEWCCPAGHAERLGRPVRYDGLVQPDGDQRGPELHDDGHDVHLHAGRHVDDHGHWDWRERDPRHDVLPHGHRGGLERLLDRGFTQLGHRDRGAGNHEHDQHRRHEWCCPAGHAERVGCAQRYDGLVQPERDQRGPELHDDSHHIHVYPGRHVDDHGPFFLFFM